MDLRAVPNHLRALPRRLHPGRAPTAASARTVKDFRSFSALWMPGIRHRCGRRWLGPGGLLCPRASGFRQDDHRPSGIQRWLTSTAGPSRSGTRSGCPARESHIAPGAGTAAARWRHRGCTCSSRLPPASHPPFSRSSCRRPPTRCRSCRGSNASGASRHRSASPASRRSACRSGRPRAGCRSASSSSPRSGARTCCCAWPHSSRPPRRGAIAVHRCPDTVSRRSCRAVRDVTDDRLTIMATPTRPRSHVTFPAAHPRTPPDYHPLGRDRTGCCWFPLCANRISDLKPPVRTGYFRSVPCHWR